MKLTLKIQVVVKSKADWAGSDEDGKPLLNSKVRFYPWIIKEENETVYLMTNGLDIGYFVPDKYRTREMMKGPIDSILKEILEQPVGNIKPTVPVPLDWGLFETITEDILSALTKARYEVITEEFEYSFENEYVLRNNKLEELGK